MHLKNKLTMEMQDVIVITWRFTVLLHLDLINYKSTDLFSQVPNNNLVSKERLTGNNRYYCSNNDLPVL